MGKGLVEEGKRTVGRAVNGKMKKHTKDSLPSLESFWELTPGK